MSFLKINNLSVDYKMRRETVHAAKNINIEVSKGEILGLVGESGSGKSTVGNAIINLIDEPGKVSNGTIHLGEINIHDDLENIIKYRGKKIGLIFQSQVSYLIPIFGTILSYIFLKELITTKVLISLIAVVIGIYFVKKAN